MIKYYPSFRVKTKLNTRGNQFTSDGKPYSGLYYETFENTFFTGNSPIDTKSKPLQKGLVSSLQSTAVDSTALTRTKNAFPTPYYPYPLQKDYDKGFINRYFLKRENDRGYVIEISESEYADILNGDANYDVSRLQVIKILWKISGPLRNKRISQYDTRAGIIDTNERLVLDAEKTFVGIKAFINGKYDQFARPTE